MLGKPLIKIFDFLKRAHDTHKNGFDFEYLTTL